MEIFHSYVNQRLDPKLRTSPAQAVHLPGLLEVFESSLDASCTTFPTAVDSLSLMMVLRI